jgi:hypothetical protein
MYQSISLYAVLGWFGLLATCIGLNEQMFHVGCLISVWSDKLTISKQRSRSRVAISRVTLFGLNALVSRTARMFLRPD